MVSEGKAKPIRCMACDQPVAAKKLVPLTVTARVRMTQETLVTMALVCRTCLAKRMVKVPFDVLFPTMNPDSLESIHSAPVVPPEPA